MVLNLIHRFIDTLLRIDRGRVLNDEFGAETSRAEIDTEMTTIVDKLKMEAFDANNGLVNYQGLNNSPTYNHYMTRSS